MNSKGEMIDLKRLIVNVAKKWKFIGAVGAVFALIFGMYAVFIVKPLYVAHAQLIPTKGSGDVQFAAAAALMGSKSSGNDAELFQHLLTSRKVAKEFIKSKCSDGTGKKADVMASIMKIDYGSPEEIDNAIDLISKSVSVDVDSKGGVSVVAFSFSATSPWFAKYGGNCFLQSAIFAFNEVKGLRYKTSSRHLEIAVEKAYQEWQLAAEDVAEFKDRNRSIILPNQELSLSKLEIEKSAKEQKYLLARREQEEMNFNSVKMSEPMVIIDSLELPIKKSKPNRRMYVLGGLFLGIFLSTGYFAIKLGDRAA